MFAEFRSQARAILERVLRENGISAAPTFSIPPVEEFGDLSTNVCFQLTSTFKKPPEEVAKLLADQIKPSGLIKEVKAERGYLNFYIDYPVLTKELFEGIGLDFGKGTKKEKVILEHTSANPDGPLHIGHLRNAVIGDALARILKFAGYETEVHYYLNDMGKQEAVVVWGMEKFKVEEGKKDHATAGVYIKASTEIEEQGLEEEVSQLLERYEEEDKGTVERFKKAVEFCLEGIKETLQRLGIKHDKFVWESAFVWDGSVGRVIEKLEKTRYARKEESALILSLTEFGIEKEMILTRKDGTSLYIARDLTHHIWKLKQGRCINIWGADHKLVADQLKVGLSILDLEAPEFIIHEFISLPEGGMSTRKGVFVSADQLIEETVKKAYEEVKSRRPDMDGGVKRRIAEDVGVSAVRFNIARIAPEKSMVFRWEEALDFERQGAPFIQYAYARGKKILKKAAEKDTRIKDNEMDDIEKRLIKTVSRFPEIVEDAALSRKVSAVATYAIELANTFHSFYMSSRVLGDEKEDFRLSLVNAAVVVLGSVMELLGVKPLEEM